jgi:hypothetical protein
MRPDERIAELSAALRECQEMQPKAIQMLRNNGFVLHGDGSGHTAAEWEKLAFTLYSDLCEINHICREVLEEEE